MMPTRSTNSDSSDVERVAADWALRLDRGLTAKEQDDCSQWLAEDARHREALALCRWGWEEFDRLAGLQIAHPSKVDPDLLARGNPFAREARFALGRFAAIPLVAALAAVAFAFWPDERRIDDASAESNSVERIARIEKRTLEDGSIVMLNRGASIEAKYDSEVRRIRLLRGEASFEVAKDPDRPFAVEVGGVDVRAVGTQFNIRLTDDSVDVIVSEGIVYVQPSKLGLNPNSGFTEPLLEVGQKAVVALGGYPARVDVSNLSASDMDRELRWQPRLLDFDDAPMSEIVQEFNRRNEVQLFLGSHELEDLHLSNFFWSDNVEGFVRLMESSFGMKAVRRGSDRIILYR